MAFRNSFVSLCTGLRVFIFAVCVFICDVSSAPFHEDNTLTIDTAESTVPWSTYSPDNVRCYCNLPICVSTGYMCKSEGGGCFSEVVDPDQPPSFRSPSSADVYKGRHGCLELLQDKDQWAECRNMPSANKATTKGHPRSLLLCCFKDMCNHIDSPETQTMLNGTLLGSTLMDSPNHSLMSSHLEPNMAASPGYNSNEVWFKAAIIAVPICGVVILFLLIFLAVKILRTDTLTASSKLGPPYHHGIERKTNRDHFDAVHHQSSVSLKKVPLLIHQHHHAHDVLSGACTNHSADELLKNTAVPLLVQNETGVSHSYDKKNEANAKLNTAHAQYSLIQNKDRDTSSAPLLHKPSNISTSSNNVYRNVNLSLTPTPQSVQQPTTDKLYDKQALSAVINWGAPSPSSSPV
ncbi:hypothetical protein CBL_00125 [Carabus blaptoides fortunei]